ncbi:MAG: cytochrome b [Paracoccaceae bacterium]|nr:cytochrome b [Paracoccaceae bacterium]
MPLRNGPREFGAISRAIHWLMAVGILGTSVLGIVILRLTPSLSNIWLYGLHKTIGIVLLAAVLLRLLWHWASPTPAPLDSHGAGRARLARRAHWVLYALMIAIPLIGWAGSAATGIDVIVFGRWTLPPLVPASATAAKGLMALHHWLALAMLGLVAVHVAGALSRRDGTLRRMILGRPSPENPNPTSR